MMTTETPPDGTRATKQELVRPRAGRVVAGVAAAVARTFDVPLWLVRLVLVITVPMGGLGFVAYLAGWLLIRDETKAEPHAVRLVEGIGEAGWPGVVLAAIGVLAINSSINLIPGGALFGLVLVVIGGLMYMGKAPFAIVAKNTSHSETKGTPTKGAKELASMTTPTATTLVTPSGGEAPPSAPIPPVPSAPRPPKPPRPRSALGRITFAAMLIGVGTLALIERLAPDVDFVLRHYLSLLLAITGVGLVVGAWLGRARGLIVAGIVLLPMLMLSPLTEVDYGRLTRTVETPTTLSEVRSTYAVDVGSLLVDLSAVDFKGDSIEIVASADLGEVIIVVPDDITVTGRAQTDIGEVSALGRTSSGFGSIQVRIDQTGSNGSLDLTATVDVGRVLVTTNRSDPGIGHSDVPVSRVVVTDAGDRNGSYDLGFGKVTVDLTQLVLSEKDTLRFNLGVGELIVIIDKDTPTWIDASAGIGDVTVLKLSDSGLSPRVSTGDKDALLTIDLRVGAGTITVLEES